MALSPLRVAKKPSGIACPLLSSPANKGLKFQALTEPGNVAVVPSE